MTATYNSSASNLERLADEQQTSKTHGIGNLVSVKCDFTDETSVQNLLRAAEDKVGRPVNVLVRE